MKYISYALAVFATVCVQQALATTYNVIDFKQLVAHSEVAAEVTVIDMQVVEGGFFNSERSEKKSAPPLGEPEPDQQDVEIVTDSSNAEELSSSAPQGLPVEGGRMLYTDVTFAVDQEVFGVAAGETITIRMAGGTNGEVSAVVAGIPQFELNGRYMLFLRSDFENYADPITGVNQGFFQIVSSPDDAQDMMLNANGDIVVGVQNEQVVVRYNADRSLQDIPKFAPPPKPESGIVTRAGASLEAVSYWDSQEPAMLVDDFLAEVQAAKGVIQ